MLKKTIIYEDFDGNEQKEDFYFNMSKADLLLMTGVLDGDLQNKLISIRDSKDVDGAVKFFTDMIEKSVGIKSDDGKRFIRNEEITKNFMESNAFSELLVELISTPEALKNFIIGILPAQFAEAAKQNLEKSSEEPESKSE